jgi:tetraacyldisaccharide 4'-kinase
VPVYVAAERYEAGVLAEADTRRSTPRAVHILDDGFQHRQLHRDVDILLLNGSDLRDRLLPAGNLREPLDAATRASVIAIPADEAEIEAAIRERGWTAPVWRLRRRMEIPAVDAPVLAFCGIARPEQFFAGLRRAQVDIAGTKVFGDHHRYSKADLDRLAAYAGRRGASALLTTEKDAVRLAGLKAALPVLTVGLRTEIEDEVAAMEWLVGRLVPEPGTCIAEPPRTDPWPAAHDDKA